MVDGGAPRRPTQLVGGGALTRFSSRLGRLSHVYLKDRLTGASEYLRIAGYFRSSIFDLVNEEIESIGTVRVVCNADLDPHDIGAAKQAREQMLKERWNDVDDSVESFLRRPRYRRLYEILKRGNVEVRVVSRADAPFLHGKAGVIRRRDGSATAFMGSLNETREGWSENYELVWEDTSPDGVAWVEEEFEYLWTSASRCRTRSSTRSAEARGGSRSNSKSLDPRTSLPPPWSRATSTGAASSSCRGNGLRRSVPAPSGGLRQGAASSRRRGRRREDPVARRSALVCALLGDGPVLILCPATLTGQWQMELKDKLNIPSAVWLSTEKAWQLDPDELPLPSVGPEGHRRSARVRSRSSPPA